MDLVHAEAELRARVAAWKRAGERVALVPTMGNLHEGHLGLVQRARELARRVVVSVFVNPTQFGPGEDFERYPRTLSQDRERLETVGADLLFAPEVATMYPLGLDGVVRVSVPRVTVPLEGAFRPGHFDGVATVVCILFNLVQPDVAVFGEKDYQQLLVVRRMVEGLRLPVQVVGAPTRRQDDGLALSSRNQYLDREDRVRAPALQRCLRSMAEALRRGRRDFAELERAGWEGLEAAGLRPQYLSIRSPDLGDPDPLGQEWVVLAAALLGRTRLIDNVRIEI